MTWIDAPQAANNAAPPTIPPAPPPSRPIPVPDQDGLRLTIQADPNACLYAAYHAGGGTCPLKS